MGFLGGGFGPTATGPGSPRPSTTRKGRICSPYSDAPIVRDAHYTVAEAEKLAEFIGYFFDVESDRQIVFRWCDQHRMSGFLCRDQHAPEEDAFFIAPFVGN